MTPASSAAVTVADLMTDCVLTIQDDQSIALAAQMMIWSGVRHLLVHHQETLVGIVSERDVLSVDTRQGPVRTAMKRSVGTVRPSAPIEEATRAMAAAKGDCLAVVEEGRLCGVLTMTDVLAFLSGHT